jgi:hypothetical protein
MADTNNNGSLDLAAADHNTFGYWTKNFSNATIEAGATYRARFLVRSTVADAARTPSSACV